MRSSPIRSHRDDVSLSAVVPSLRHAQSTFKERTLRFRNARQLHISIAKIVPLDEVANPSVSLPPCVAGASCFVSAQYGGNSDSGRKVAFSTVVSCEATSPLHHNGIIAATRLSIDLPIGTCATDFRHAKVSVMLYRQCDPAKVVEEDFRAQLVKHPTAGVIGLPIAKVALCVESLLEAWCGCGANTCIDVVPLEVDAPHQQHRNERESLAAVPTLGAQLLWTLSEPYDDLSSLASVVLSDVTASPPPSPLRLLHHPEQHITFVDAAATEVPADAAPKADFEVRSSTSPTTADDVTSAVAAWVHPAMRSVKPLDLRRVSSSLESETQTATAAAATAESRSTSPRPLAELLPSSKSFQRSTSVASSIESLIPSSPDRAAGGDDEVRHDGVAAATPHASRGSLKRVMSTQPTAAAAAAGLSSSRRGQQRVLSRDCETKPPLSAVRPPPATSAAAGINTSLTKPSSRPTTPRASLTTGRGRSSAAATPRTAAPPAAPVDIPPPPNAPVSLAAKSWWATVPLGVDPFRPHADSGWFAIRTDAANCEAAAKALFDEDLCVTQKTHAHVNAPQLLPLTPDTAPWCPAGAQGATCQRKFSSIVRAIRADDEYLCHGTESHRRGSVSPQPEDRRPSLARCNSLCRAGSCGESPAFRSSSQPRSRASSAERPRTHLTRPPPPTRSGSVTSVASSRAAPTTTPARGPPTLYRIPWYGNSPHANFLSKLFQAAAAGQGTFVQA